MHRHALKACTAALVLAASASAQAQLNPTIYGLLDMSVGRFQSPGSRYLLRAESGRLTTSFLGIRGSDDLGGGLRARFGLEAYLRVDDGSVGRSPTDPFWSRTAYVGLQGAFGTSLLGRLPTPLWTSTRLFNPFGESVGFSPSIRQYFGGAILGDSRWNNSVAFSSPEPEGGNGFSYGVQFNASEGGVGATGKNIGANVLYVSGPLSATGAWQRVRNGIDQVPAGFDHQSTYQVGASYEFPVVRIYGQAGTVSTNATTHVKTALYQLGAAVPVGLGFVIGSFGHAKTEVSGTPHQIHRTFSIGYDYYLSKNTDLYAVVMNE
ncbi:MAG: porin, partial [Pseudomonadota bacterium]|nr:porin [Pseudomonadota bacterium]